MIFCLLRHTISVTTGVPHTQAADVLQRIRSVQQPGLEATQVLFCVFNALRVHRADEALHDAQHTCMHTYTHTPHNTQGETGNTIVTYRPLTNINLKGPPAARAAVLHMLFDNVGAASMEDTRQLWLMQQSVGDLMVCKWHRCINMCVHWYICVDKDKKVLQYATTSPSTHTCPSTHTFPSTHTPGGLGMDKDILRCHPSCPSRWHPLANQPHPPQCQCILPVCTRRAAVVCHATAAPSGGWGWGCGDAGLGGGVVCSA